MVQVNRSTLEEKKSTDAKKILNAEETNKIIELEVQNDKVQNYSRVLRKVSNCDNWS
ncbi:MAG: hypothetical protein VXW87_01695 [Pseudomonadota bacterium]|nr:hypothetical protein [Pseudomonadota bacterium]